MSNLNEFKVEELTDYELKQSIYRVINLIYKEIIACSKKEKVKEIFHNLISVNLSYKAVDFFRFKRVHFEDISGNIKGLSIVKQDFLNYALKSLMFIQEGGPKHAYAKKSIRSAKLIFSADILLKALKGE